MSDAELVSWQDIATAPKDGTEFLAFDSRSGKMDVCWWHPTLHYVASVQFDLDGCEDGEFDHSDGNITHWRPLPDPPQKQGD